MRVSFIIAISLFSLVQDILCESDERQTRNDNVDDIDRILQNRFPSCSTNTRCVGIQGNCCPTNDGIMLDCCGAMAMPVPSPRLIPGPTILVMLPPVVSSRCSSHANCTNLDGDCCPNAAGKFLNCCTTRPTAPVPPPVSSNTCSSNPKCAALNLQGSCCPTNDGFFLDCCRLSNPPVVAPVPVRAPFSAPVVTAKCNLNPKCAALNLQGNCCPNNSGKFLDCCDSKSQPTPVSVPAPTPAKPTWVNPKCSANVRCNNQGLTGNCCPTSQGKFLDCCKHTSSPKCSNNPVCASRGLTGNCCPTAEGTFLSCCKK